MPNAKPPHPADLRQLLVELVRAGRSPVELSLEFGPSAQSFVNWVATDNAPGLSASMRHAASSTVLISIKRDELARLRRENRQFKLERAVLAKATAWFAAKGDKPFNGSSNS